MKKKLILVAAPPACGKTYAAKLIAGELGHCVYLDKDDLSPLVTRASELGGHELNMDGAFYKQNLRAVEYATVLNIAIAALPFEDTVILNAPLSKEVRDVGFMRDLKARVAENGAELMVVWVVTPLDVCYERMVKRNAERDRFKLADWDSYVKNIDYSPPTLLEDENAIDKLIVFNSENDETTKESLKKALETIRR